MSLWKLILKILGLHDDSTETTTTATVTDQTTTRGIVKRSLHIGINNYPGSANDLNGCVNDANGWKTMLAQNYGFTKMKILLDQQATRANVKRELEAMVKESKDGDILVLTYSGHGTSTADRSGDEADGRDEAICLYDGLMIDDQIRGILNKLPKGVKFTFISDSCHSGTVTRSFITALGSDVKLAPRYLPPEDEMEVASLNALPLKKGIFVPQEDMPEILISGCLPTEYSYDAYFNGKHKGAFSHYALLILRDNPNITYADFYKKLRTKLPSGRYPQTPQLEGSKENKNSLMFQ